ncbi:conserved hypothetical protein [Pyrobaculum islandicum DSM 4184]|uniref:Uncharacterized protein n=1 Tax=Pyrobaculum islandicum (strain DSM 4184 / JCM 9189 / GEO3) TaxID=384616 RepID=A1RSH2_PYRIL|nr:hypothetical protein [Pyrobaculum islandicum]ABL87904.1 conserved hypothetical protein [Pyrobaculum islandicum DSM 4184]
MCEVVTEGDVIVFSAPETELTMAYLTVRTLAEHIEFVNGTLRISPALPEIETSLKSLCTTETSTVLLDLKESLLHLGWLVEGGRDVVKIRRSWRAGVSGFLVVEYDKAARALTIVTTQICLAETLRQLGFKVSTAKYLVEAVRYVSTVAEAIELGESLSQTIC